MDSIDESYAKDNSDDGSISKNSIEDIWDGKHLHPNINARDDRLMISDQINKYQS